MRTNVAASSQCRVLEKARSPVAEVQHASNHEQGRLLHRLRAVRAVRSSQVLAPRCQDRDAEATPSAPPRASFDRSAWQCVVFKHTQWKTSSQSLGVGEVSCVCVFGGVPPLRSTTRKEIHTDLIEPLRFHFVRRELTMVGSDQEIAVITKQKDDSVDDTEWMLLGQMVFLSGTTRCEQNVVDLIRCSTFQGLKDQLIQNQLRTCMVPRSRMCKEPSSR